MSNTRSLSTFSIHFGAGLLLACSGSPEPTPNTPPPPAPPAASEESTQEPPAAPVYSVHEWGLVDFGPADYEVAAGPGSTPEDIHPPAPPMAPPRPAPVRPATIPPSPMHPVPMRPMGRRKPVVYVHLQDATPVEFTLTVTGGGAIAEHWPPASVDGTTLRWAGVVAAPGTCTGGVYPTRESAACSAAPDGYCELADLPGYETSDGACLTYNGQTWDHLFYRSHGTGATAPIEAQRIDGVVHVHNRQIENSVGALYYVRRGAIGSTAPVLASRIDTPSVGERAVFPEPDAQTTAVARRELSAALRAGGLTDPEASAFENAWFAELFENGTTGGAPLVQEALIYVLPEANLGPVSRLDFTPAPESVHRVFLVRTVL